MKDLNQYPNFNSISFSDTKWYGDYYKEFQPYADHYFGNLFAWLNFHNDLSYSVLNNNIIFRYTDVFDPTNHSYSYTILGKTLAQETFDTFYTTSEHVQAKFHMVPEILINGLDQRVYDVIEDRDSWDYVYNINDFINLEGPDYRRLRYQIRTFEKENGENSKLVPYHLEHEHNNPTLLKSFKLWKKVYQFGNDPEEIETHAMQERISNFSEIPFNCLQYLYNGALQGFVIYSYPPQGEYAIIHHLKCSYELEFMFDYIFYEALKIFHNEGKKYLNLEQDLGKPGLRKHKELLRPERFLKKYIIKKS